MSLASFAGCSGDMNPPDTSTAALGLLSGADCDSDGIDDAADNCIDVANPDQHDHNQNGYGNACDADVNNDGATGLDDLGICLADNGKAESPCDLNADGGVGLDDVAVVLAQLNQQPGPSGLRCAGVVPCLDSDQDGQLDSTDNCIDIANPEQGDVDEDGYGDVCDQDVNNNGAVDAADLGACLTSFGTSLPGCDFNRNGTVDLADVSAVELALGLPPGPSGLSCAGTIPCPFPITDRSIVLTRDNFMEPGVFGGDDSLGPSFLLNPPTNSAFSFERALRKISSSGGGPDTREAAVALLAQLLAGFNQDSELLVHPVNGLSFQVDDRDGEANLDPNTLIDQMQPLAVFNRFDLAPADGSHCGEYRIVYGRHPFTTFDRFLVILEAAMPNINPQAANPLEGCREVVDFWTGLSQPGLSTEEITERLRIAYFEGIADRWPAIIDHQNYGVPFGQIRTNQFVDGAWQLAEYRTSVAGSGAPRIVRDTVKGNPLVELYDEANPEWVPASEGGAFQALQKEFQHRFIDNYMESLFTPELDAAAEGKNLTAHDIINGMGAGFEPRFDEFQSVSQGSSDQPQTNANTPFMLQINDKAAALAIPVPNDFSGAPVPHNVLALNRAGAMTCGGCHQFSVGKVIGVDNEGEPVSWPRSAFFVHVAETGGLSAALRDFFIPARLGNVQQFTALASVSLVDGSAGCGTEPAAQSESASETEPASETAPAAGPAAGSGSSDTNSGANDLLGSEADGVAQSEPVSTHASARRRPLVSMARLRRLVPKQTLDTTEVESLLRSIDHARTPMQATASRQALEAAVKELRARESKLPRMDGRPRPVH